MEKYRRTCGWREWKDVLLVMGWVGDGLGHRFPDGMSEPSGDSNSENLSFYCFPFSCKTGLPPRRVLKFDIGVRKVIIYVFS